ncbi:HIT family protein [Paenibacillus sp. N3.4]|uniref:HIT family protein n=1 Tax=Paenibacillus sp. N3.4 TaxID=2603222 RepID=UPI0011C86F33|nr:HIT family protein [Paenibacillus sp. N3.4]TXK85770.1 HIT family protein [Paenibacillus sp. N3.4]
MITDCLGCRLANKLETVQIIYEDDLIICFLDIAPLNEGHTLILPKKHYRDVDDLGIEVATAIMVAAAKISRALKISFSPDGISIIQNGGQFNDLGHYHMHVFPRYIDDGFAWMEPEDVTEAKDRLGETKERLANVLISIKE